MNQLVAEHAVRPVIGKAFPLADGAGAFEEGAVAGRVVVTV